MITEHTPHKLSWYYGDKTRYSDILVGNAVQEAEGRGGLVEIQAGDAIILFGDGVNLRLHAAGASRPTRHQLLIEFEDGTALSAAVQMYGGVGAFLKGKSDNPYYLVAKERPSPFSDDFDLGYFQDIVRRPESRRLSLKALLATEQRIPGLGNGVLQDILFNSRMHPKRKVDTLNDGDIEALFNALKSTLGSMAEQGGRDTELDIFGRPGGYRTIMSKNTVSRPCPACGTPIGKETYMGGTIYCCVKCQRS